MLKPKLFITFLLIVSKRFNFIIQMFKVRIDTAPLKVKFHGKYNVIKMIWKYVYQCKVLLCTPALKRMKNSVSRQICVIKAVYCNDFYLICNLDYQIQISRFCEVNSEVSRSETFDLNSITEVFINKWRQCIKAPILVPLKYSLFVVEAQSNHAATT